VECLLCRYCVASDGLLDVGYIGVAERKEKTTTIFSRNFIVNGHEVLHLLVS